MPDVTAVDWSAGQDESILAIIEGLSDGLREPSVPNSIIRLVAGPFSLQVNQIWQGTRISEYLAAPDARRHLWHACLSAPNGPYRNEEILLEEVYAKFTFWKAKDLAADAYGGQPKGLLKVLSKLGARARQPELYRSLLQVLLVDGHGTKIVSHATELPDGLILALAAVPDELAVRSLFTQIASMNMTAEHVRFLGWAVKRVELLCGKEAAQRIRGSQSLRQEFSRSMHSFSFPPPPWAGNETLVPITSRAELRKLADRFGNCLTSSWRASEAVLGVISGQMYFYEWQGAEAALIQVKRLAPLGWQLEELRGPANEDLSDKTTYLIEETLLASGVLCPFRPFEDDCEPVPF